MVNGRATPAHPRTHTHQEVARALVRDGAGELDAVGEALLRDHLLKERALGAVAA